MKHKFIGDGGSSGGSDEYSRKSRPVYTAHKPTIWHSKCLSGQFSIKFKFIFPVDNCCALGSVHLLVTGGGWWVWGGGVT